MLRWAQLGMTSDVEPGTILSEYEHTIRLCILIAIKYKCI